MHIESEAVFISILYMNSYEKINMSINYRIFVKDYKIELTYKKYDDYNIGEYYVITKINNERQYSRIEDCRCAI